MAIHTFKFCDIFPDYGVFKELIEERSTIPEKDLDEATLSYIWNVINRQFAISEVMYDVKEAFINRFLNEFDDYFLKIKRERELINKIYTLSDEELILASESLNNFANNPNDLPEDPTAPLNFISSQNWGRVKNGKLQAYFEALNNLPSYRAGEIIKIFRPLFWDIQNPICYYYENKED